MEAVDNVIKELGAFGKQTVMVFNKIDKLANRELAETFMKRFPGSVAISARTGEGVSTLVSALEERARFMAVALAFCIPTNESALLAEIHRVGHVLELKYEGRRRPDRRARFLPELPRKLERSAHICRIVQRKRTLQDHRIGIMRA